MSNRVFAFPAGKSDWGALRIAGIYLLVGALWILFSDQLATKIAPNQSMLTTISIYKGWGFILVTAIMLFWLIQRHSVMLSLSEERLLTLTNALPALISYVDKDRRYRFTNQTYETWYGYKGDGKHITDVVGADAYKQLAPHIDTVLGGETVVYEMELNLKQAGRRFVSATYVPDMGPDGQARGFFSLVQDITERKQAEEELRQWADAFEHCAHGIAIGDPITNRIVVCNTAFAMMHKLRAEDIVGTTVISLYAPSDHDHVRRNIKKADQIGHAQYEANMIRKSGETFPTQMDLVSVCGEDGDLLYRVATAQDISARRKAEKEIADQANILAHINDAVIIVNEDLIITAWNSAAEQMYGWKAEEVIGRVGDDFLKTDFFGTTRATAIQSLRETGEFSAEVTQLRKDGSRFHVDARTVALRTENGEIRSLISVNRDITERKHAEQVLRESEERFAIVFHSSPTSIILTRLADGIIMDVNEAFCQLFGYSREEVLGHTSLELGIADPESRQKAVERLKEEGVIRNLEQKARHRDGRQLNILNSIETISLNGDLYALTTIIDFTERKQAEASALESEARYHRILDAMMEGCQIIDHEWRYVYINQVAAQQGQHTPEELLHHTMMEMYPGIEQTELFASMQQCMEERISKHLDNQFVFPNGEIGWYELSIQPAREGIFILSTDITGRKRAEQALQRANDELELKVQERTASLSHTNSLLQELMDYMPDHIYFKDTRGRFIRNSKSQAEMLGLSNPDQAIGKTDFDFFPHAAKAYAEEQDVMRTGQPLVDFEEQVIWPDKSETWVSTTKVPLRNSEGQTIGIFGISRDITERKHAEQAIRQLNLDLIKQAEQLHTANKELEAFSYSISHDLRAPLRAINGYTRILVEDYASALDDEGRRVCNVITTETRRMGTLIDDLLAFSRLSRKEIQNTKIDMKALAYSVFGELTTEAQRQRIDFQSGRLPATQGDAALIHQVWVNLLSNAIKFSSRRDRAIIEVGTKKSEHENIYYVRDNGAGFDFQYVDKLFGVFQRLHSEDEFEGTGVGLAIVQRIIQRHRGRVWAEGNVDKGATFYFALPRERENHE